jgi:Flp pilus assembly protein TadG
MSGQVRSRVRQWRNDDGSVMVEFGLIAVTFVLLLLGVVELGRLVLVYTTMANSARAGTRYAIVHGGELTSGASGPGNTTAVQTAVNNYASAGLVNTAILVVTVAYPDGTNTAGSRVTVTVQYPFDPLVGYFNTLLNTNLSSTSEGIITF